MQFAGPPTGRMARRPGNAGPPVGTRGSAKPAPMTSGPANVSAAPPFHAGEVNGPTRSWGFLPVGAGTAARSAAKGVYHAAVRMTLRTPGSRPRGEPPPNSRSFTDARLRIGLCRPEVYTFPGITFSWGRQLANEWRRRGCVGARPVRRGAASRGGRRRRFRAWPNASPGLVATFPRGKHHFSCFPHRP